MGMNWELYEKLEDFVGDHLEEQVENYIQESYWYGTFDTNYLHDLVENKAKELNYTADQIDELLEVYDEFFSDMYDCTEKGLS